MRCYFKIPKDDEQVDFLDTPYYYFKEGLTIEEIEEIEKTVKNIEWGETSTFDEEDPKKIAKYRKSKLKWLDPNLIPEISDKIWDMFQEANNGSWRFDVRGFTEAYQYTVYQGENKSFYDWHRDTGPDNTFRKISATIQLSDPKEYEGGELEIERGSISEDCYNKGSIMFFPSITWHKVNPITKGERRSLVIWLGGPPLK
jgi:PKHD-type hydroxylase